jgi:hypothetical protein
VALISPLGSGWAFRLANIWPRSNDPDPALVKEDFTPIRSSSETKINHLNNDWVLKSRRTNEELGKALPF